MDSCVATVTKIFKTTNGDLLGVSGDFNVGTALANWYMNGADITKYPSNKDPSNNWHAGMLVIRRSDRHILKYETEPFPFRIEDKFFAIGSGRDYALAAMYLGKTAYEAVEIACALDSNCGNGIDTLTF